MGVLSKSGWFVVAAMWIAGCNSSITNALMMRTVPRGSGAIRRFGCVFRMCGATAGAISKMPERPMPDSRTLASPMGASRIGAYTYYYRAKNGSSFVAPVAACKFYGGSMTATFYL